LLDGIDDKFGVFPYRSSVFGKETVSPIPEGLWKEDGRQEKGGDDAIERGTLPTQK